MFLENRKDNIMKRFLTLLLVTCCLFLGLTSLTATANSLKVGVLANNPPYTIQNHSGFDLALSQQLAAKVKVIPQKSNSQLITALKKGRVDLIICDVSLLSKQMSHSQSFLHPANVLFTRHDSKTKSILKLNQKKVGYLKNNPHHALLTTLATKPQGFATESALLTALNTGKIKAAILTDYQYNQLLAANPQLVTAQDETDQKQVGQVLTKISDPKLTSQSLVVASFKKPRLQKKINHKLKQLQDNGTLSKLSMKYFHQDWTYQ